MRGTTRAALSDGATKARLGRIIAHAREQDLTSTDLVLASRRVAILIRRYLRGEAASDRREGRTNKEEWNTHATHR